MGNQLGRKGRALSAVAGGVAAALTFTGPVFGGDSTVITVYRPSDEAARASHYSSITAADSSSTGGTDFVGGQFAVIVDRRDIQLNVGDNSVVFGKVPAELDPATVHFRSQSDPSGTQVVHQTFANDLKDDESLLSRYLGHEIVAVTTGGDIRGTLIQFREGHLVLETRDTEHPIRIVPRGENLLNLRLGRLADGLTASPTLRWQIRSRRGGTHASEVTYRAGGFAWAADYAATYDARRRTVDLRGWASIRNSSGASFDNARVVLVSGAPDAAALAHSGQSYQRIRQPVEQRTFALQQPASLRDRQTVQMELFNPITAAPAREMVIYEALPDLGLYYSTGFPNTDCYAFQYQASRNHGDRYVELVVPVDRRQKLPEGRARVFVRDEEGVSQLLSEDHLQPARSGTVRLKVGSTARIGGERRQLDCRPDDRARLLRERIEVKVRNHSDRARTVVVREFMQRWPNWAVESESEVGETVGPAREWAVELPAGGTKTVSYTVVYNW